MSIHIIKADKIITGKRAGTPGFDMLIGLFVQIADGSGGFFRSP